MFKNHSIRMKLVNDKKTQTHPNGTTINYYNTPKVERVAIAVGSLYALKVAVDTSAKIALHIATK